MHICFLNMPIEYYSPISGGAISTIIMECTKELVSRGHQISVLTIVNGDEQHQAGEVIPLVSKQRNDLSFVQRRISAVRQKINSWSWPYYEYYLNSALRQLRQLSPAPDAVILFNDLVTQKYVKKTMPKTKVLVWLQNEWRTDQKDLQTVTEATDKFLTCSQYIKEWTAKTHNISLSKFEVVNSGVDLETFFPRADYLAPSETLRVLFIGRLDPNKGPDVAADAVAALQAEGLSMSLTVAGGLWFYGHGNEMADPFFQRLKPKMDAVQANYLGYVTRDKVPALVREHDIVCVLSRSQEPFGLVILEAMASGCAVIASDRGGLPEACGGAAMLVNPDDMEGVIGCLRSLATDPKLLQSQKQKSVKRAERASWGESVSRLEEVIKL